MNYNVFPNFPRDHRDIPYWQTEDEHPIYAKDQKDVPDWMKAHHQWEPAIEVNKLQKHQLKVKLCCAKCEEKIIENIREVRGVFDVRADRKIKKVVVVAMPGGLDEHEVLRMARKVHKKARFVDLDVHERQKPKENKPKDKGHGQDNKGSDGHNYDDDDNRGDHNQGNQGGGKAKKGKALQSNPAHSVLGVMPQFPWGQQFWPIQPPMGPRYYYPPSHIQRFPDPSGQYVYFL